MPKFRMYLQRVQELFGINEVIFYRITWSRHRHVLEAFDRPQYIELNLFWETGAQAVWIHQIRLQTFGLEPNLHRVRYRSCIGIIIADLMRSSHREALDLSLE